MTAILNDAWDELTKDLNENRMVWWKKITDRLTDPKRKYHNIQHLEKKYRMYLDIKHLVTQKKAMEFALIFSYFEYEPKFIDTDERNIEHFKTFCRDCGITRESEVCREVIALLGCIGSHITEEHKTEGAIGHEDKHYFLDLDMVVLGSDPEVYTEYYTKVKEEYDFLPEAVYKALRVKVLQTFLQIPNIYATKEFREKYESQAHENIQNEIKLLQ